MEALQATLLLEVEGRHEGLISQSDTSNLREQIGEARLSDTFNTLWSLDLNQLEHKVLVLLFEDLTENFKVEKWLRAAKVHNLRLVPKLSRDDEASIRGI